MPISASQRTNTFHYSDYPFLRPPPSVCIRSVYCHLSTKRVYLTPLSFLISVKCTRIFKQSFFLFFPQTSFPSLFSTFQYVKPLCCASIVGWKTLPPSLSPKFCFNRNKILKEVQLWMLLYSIQLCFPDSIRSFSISIL